MATLTLQITAGAQTGGRVRTVTTTDLNRFLACYRWRYQDQTSTDLQIVTKWADEIIAGIIGNIRGYEEQAAKDNSIIGITNIEVT